jgi:hypothetical protein
MDQITVAAVEQFQSSVLPDDQDQHFDQGEHMPRSPVLLQASRNARSSSHIGSSTRHGIGATFFPYTSFFDPR